MKKVVGPLFLASFVSIYFLACVPQKQVSTQKISLSTVDSHLLRHKDELQVIDQKLQHKQAANEIDDTASNRIKRYIANTQIEIDTLIGRNSILIGQEIIKKEDWNRLQVALISSQKSLKTIDAKVSFINDLIQRNTVVKLEQDVLFGPGQYKVDAATTQKIKNLFEPVAKEINLFTQKYPSFPLALVITAKGYADATAISEGSSLYKDLKEKLTLENDNPTSADLNKKLSNERAKEVISLFEKYTKDKAPAGTNIKNILYVHEGKGERFPNPSITDYKVDDSRRRVVLLFWSVFPDE
jgi:outer membrane protein OmpA-like peptidoglycan-associated protein